MLYEVRMKVLDVQRNMIKNVQVGLPVREEHDALEDAADCRRICRRMAGTQRSWQHTTVIQNKTTLWFKIFICPCFRSVQIPLHGLHHGFQLVSQDPEGRFYRSLFQVSHCRPAMGLDLPRWIPYFLED